MRWPASVRGAVYGLSAAALFGVSAPLSKRLLDAMPPLLLAALLYCGGGLGLSIYRLAVPRPPSEKGLERGDARLLVPLVVTGGAIAPVLMLIGLGRLSGVSTSLLLNLEGPFTILLALSVFGERLNPRELGAAALMFLAAGALGVQAWEWKGDWVGVACIAGACACWALDNNLTQRLSVRDPVTVVRVKTLGAGGGMLVLAVALGQRPPSAEVALLALAVGALSYGLSILLDLYALRLLGAAREAAYFATAPFVGALASVPLLNESLTVTDVGAGAVMAVGVAVLLTERGRTRANEHTHLHVHDDLHAHAHEGVVTEPHSHAHRHLTLTHDHPHVHEPHV